MFRTVKPAGGVRTYRVVFDRVLEQQWRQGAEYALTEYVRPTRPDGFEYECTDAGQADSVEPEWPATIGETVIDGSIVWTCRDFAANAADLISSVLVTAEAGLTVDSYAQDDQAVQFSISGGLAGNVYDVTVTANTAAGDTYPETVRVTVT